MSTRYPVLPDGEQSEREAAIDAASLAVRRGELVVVPTDTVYGLGADAFDPAAVRRLLKAKGRGPEMPPPVLVSAATTLDARQPPALGGRGGIASPSCPSAR